MAEVAEKAAAEIIARLPKSYAPQDGEPIPVQLIGAKIIGIGTFADGSRLQGGGLVVEYLPSDSINARRIVFEFDEREMHQFSDEVISSASQDDCMRRWFREPRVAAMANRILGHQSPQRDIYSYQKPYAIRRVRCPATG